METPNPQSADALVFLWGLKLVYNTGCPKVHLFGDNVAATMQSLQVKVGVYPKFCR